VPYAQVMDKLVEHYGIVVSESTVRHITHLHAQKMHQKTKGGRQGLPNKVAPQSTFIAEIDGSMVPIVSSDASQADKRKGKKLQWQEARLSLVHAHDSQEIAYAATLLGDVDEAGKQLRACAKRVGFGAGHRVHGVGDGAQWIAHQMKQRFGSLGAYLLDFYHVCEYLSAAAKAIEAQPAAQESWLETQKERLKTQRSDMVLNELQGHLEPLDAADENAAVRRCYRYLSQRQEQLNYDSALRQSLPIGSGEIESAHRYVIQNRLKLSGAWWNAANVEHMLALRVNRANGEWRGYWATQYRYAA
jgi:hypothetical protein